MNYFKYFLIKKQNTKNKIKNIAIINWLNKKQKNILKETFKVLNINYIKFRSKDNKYIYLNGINPGLLMAMIIFVMLTVSANIPFPWLKCYHIISFKSWASAIASRHFV